MWIEIILALVTLLLIWKACQRPPGLPPGRWGLPLIGYIPLDGKSMYLKLTDLHKQFGDIYLWRFGTTIQIYVHDYNLLRQLFSSQDYIDRPDMELFKAFQPIPLGVSASNGPIWTNNRRFCLRYLRDLGMGKSSLVSAVHEQAQIFLEVLKGMNGKAGPIPHALNFVITNVIWKMTANKQFHMDDPKHRYLQKMMADVSYSFDGLAMADMMPWVRKIFPYFLYRKVFNEDKLRKIISDFTVFFQEMIDEHKANLDVDDPKDMIDYYLLEMRDWQEKDGTDHNDDSKGVRHETDLVMVLFDLLFAGTDTTMHNMEWIILYVANYKEVQKKLQGEIDEVLPKGTLVTLEDKPRLPYTEAVINEVVRMSNFVLLGVPHATTRDVTLGEYIIPKGAMVNSFTAGMHYDPRYWENPETFMPERWLSSEGKFVMKKEGYMPFGVGKRACIGEGLARMQLLVLTSAIFHNFNVDPPEGKVIDILPNKDVMMSHIAKEQDVVFTSRN